MSPNTNSGKLKTTFIIAVWELSNMGIELYGSSLKWNSKIAVSEEWFNELSWYKFKKVKSYFSSYWVGVIKYGREL